MSTVPLGRGTAMIGASDAIVASPGEVPWGQVTFRAEPSAAITASVPSAAWVSNTRPPSVNASLADRWGMCAAAPDSVARLAPNRITRPSEHATAMWPAVEVATLLTTSSGSLRRTR